MCDALKLSVANTHRKRVKGTTWSWSFRRQNNGKLVVIDHVVVRQWQMQTIGSVEYDDAEDCGTDHKALVVTLTDNWIKVQKRMVASKRVDGPTELGPRVHGPAVIEAIKELTNPPENATEEPLLVTIERKIMQQSQNSESLEELEAILVRAFRALMKPSKRAKGWRSKYEKELTAIKQEEEAVYARPLQKEPGG